jgi:hypothetical protein
LTREGAISELATFLIGLNPIPSARRIKLTRLGISTARTARLTRDDLDRFGVDLARYGERDYSRTQKIGAALAFLGIDGLITPSARWPCENLAIFVDNHALTERLEILQQEEIDWVAWAKSHALLK